MTSYMHERSFSRDVALRSQSPRGKKTGISTLASTNRRIRMATRMNIYRTIKLNAPTGVLIDAVSSDSQI